MNLINSTVIHFLAGLAVVFVAGALRVRIVRPGFKVKEGPGRVMFYLLAAIGVMGGLFSTLAVYAAFMGPLLIGPIVMPAVEHEYFQVFRRDAMTYVRGNVVLIGTPTTAWRGISNKSIQLTVRNKGNRAVAFVTIAFRPGRGTGRTPYEKKIEGPFAAGQDSTTFVRLPPYVSRVYFSKRTGTMELNVVAARF